MLAGHSAVVVQRPAVGAEPIKQVVNGLCAFLGTYGGGGGGGGRLDLR